MPAAMALLNNESLLEDVLEINATLIDDPNTGTHSHLAPGEYHEQRPELTLTISGKAKICISRGIGTGLGCKSLQWFASQTIAHPCRRHSGKSGTDLPDLVPRLQISSLPAVHHRGWPAFASRKHSVSSLIAEFGSCAIRIHLPCMFGDC